jgi:hypothetical protein
MLTSAQLLFRCCVDAAAAAAGLLHTSCRGLMSLLLLLLLLLLLFGCCCCCCCNCCVAAHLLQGDHQMLHHWRCCLSEHKAVSDDRLQLLPVQDIWVDGIIVSANFPKDLPVRIDRRILEQWSQTSEGSYSCNAGCFERKLACTKAAECATNKGFESSPAGDIRVPEQQHETSK